MSVFYFTFMAKQVIFTCAWSVMYSPTFSQSLMLQCLMVGHAPWPLTHTAEPTEQSRRHMHHICDNSQKTLKRHSTVTDKKSMHFHTFPASTPALKYTRCCGCGHFYIILFKSCGSTALPIIYHVDTKRSHLNAYHPHWPSNLYLPASKLRFLCNTYKKD